MCGRITFITDDLDEIAHQLDAVLDAAEAAEHRPRYNLAPTDPHFVVRLESGRRHLRRASWGWRRAVGKPSRGGEPTEKLIFNTVAETALEKAMFRAALRARRCVVPIDGFYEWTGPADARRPIRFHRPDGGLLLLAGLYDEPPGAPPAFTVLTTTPNAMLAAVHDRMPVLLAPEDLATWLAAPEPRLLKPAPEDWLVGTPANPRVNAVAFDVPEALVAPKEPPKRPSAASRQLKLFE
jgi:putative SOS response-associated peptidase YedK